MPEPITDQWMGSMEGRGVLGPYIVPAYTGDRTRSGSPHPCCAHCTHLERVNHLTPCPRCKGKR
jgi:hypothetical protein